MPVQIGTSPANFHEDPIRVMGQCHRRIERYLYVIITIKRQAQGKTLTVEQKAALGVALRYFREAAPWHMLDEEESLFPRVRLASTLDSETSGLLQGLELEHAVAHVCHLELDELGTRWIEEGCLSEAESNRFAEKIGKLSMIYHRHIHHEEIDVFPLATRLLREPEIRAIGREMEARRQVPFVYEMMARHVAESR